MTIDLTVPLMPILWSLVGVTVASATAILCEPIVARVTPKVGKTPLAAPAPLGAC